MQGVRIDKGTGQENRTGMGLGGYCVCPDCGHREPHGRGAPCYEQKCPKCGKPLMREG